MKPRPNILHLMVDQQRFDTIAALGNPIIKTPNLDRLVREGVSFTNAYSPCPVCAPARAAMIHGQYPHHIGCYENCCANPEIRVEERQTFMHGLTDAGYRTHGVGKCHFMPDKNAMRGFETRLRQEEGEGSPETNDYTRWLREEGGLPYIGDPAGTGSEMYYIPQLARVPASHHPTQWIANESVRFLDEQSGETDRPWYLYTSFLHPHPPLSPPYPWHNLYRPGDMPLPMVPAEAESLLTYVNRVQNRYKAIDSGVNRNLMQCVIAYYYACISFIDYQIGRLLETLERNGQLDRTLILFTSDHGEFLGDYNCYGKRSFLDVSAKVPLIVRWPGASMAGSRCEAPASLIDLAPTFLGVAETTLSSHELDGESLWSLASGRSERGMVFGQHAYTHHVDLSRSRSIRREFEGGDREAIAATSSYMAVDPRWKFIYSAADDAEFLFDRLADPRETLNKAGIPSHDETLLAMRRSLHAHLRSGNETAGIVGDEWKRFPHMRISHNPHAGPLHQVPDQRKEDRLPEGYRARF